MQWGKQFESFLCSQSKLIKFDVDYQSVTPTMEGCMATPLFLSRLSNGAISVS